MVVNKWMKKREHVEGCVHIRDEIFLYVKRIFFEMSVLRMANALVACFTVKYCSKHSHKWHFSAFHERDYRTLFKTFNYALKNFFFAPSTLYASAKKCLQTKMQVAWEDSSEFIMKFAIVTARHNQANVIWLV